MEDAVHIEAHDALKADYAAVRARAVTAEKDAASMREQLAILRHELDQLKRLVFGARSERFEGMDASDQMPLFETATGEVLSEAEFAAETISYTKPKKKKPVRQALPAHLPVTEIILEPQVDTSGLVRMGQEVSETLDYVPGQLRVIRRVRPKYVSETGGVIIAPLPARPIDKGIAEPSLLAHVVIEKYVDHLPVYRQLQRFEREGITLSSSTLGDWISASADLLKPLYAALQDELLDSGYVQADETPIQVQDLKKTKKTHRGYYWVYNAPLQGLVVMDYQRGRGRAGPSTFLDGYEGALQSDGYAVYESYDAHPEITTYNCMAHARRYFFDAQDSNPEMAGHALKEIGVLYDIERQLRENDSSPEERERERQEKAIPTLKRFKAYLQANPGLPKSPWGKAVFYSLARWEKLTKYTQDGRIEIDNNLVENTIRPIAIGRKNYLFAGSHNAAGRAAIIYSLVSTCKKHSINPFEWLSDVLARIPTHPAKQVHDLLPHRWEESNM